jgi:hypothetical protein
MVIGGRTYAFFQSMGRLELAQGDERVEGRISSISDQPYCGHPIAPPCDGSSKADVIEKGAIVDLCSFALSPDTRFYTALFSQHVYGTAVVLPTLGSNSK